MSGQLKNKAAVITGGSRGIGRSIIELFAREGAQVLTCSRSEPKDPLPQGISSLTADVSRSDEVKKLAGEAVSRLGKVDILVNNAGVQVEKTVVDSTDEDFETLMGVNTWGVFALCREFIPLMAGNGGGTIINIGSISADHADPSMALYNASKAFVHGLTRSIAVDHGHQGIRCNAICPGTVRTNMSEHRIEAFAAERGATKEEVLDTYIDQKLPHHQPMRRFITAEEIAAAAVYLCSDAGAAMRGAAFTIDGGWLTR